MTVFVAGCLAFASPLAADFTAKVSFAQGAVSANGNPVHQGDALDFGSTIVTGASAMAAVRIEWQIGNARCFRESMFSFGASFKVTKPAETIQCDQGAFISYGGISGKMGSVEIGKGDAPASTPKATTQYQEFDALKKALAAGMMFRVNENRKALDYNLPGNRVKSAADCASLCAREPKCNAMTFIPDQQMCWLKEQRGEAQAANGMISAVKRINAKTIYTPKP